MDIYVLHEGKEMGPFTPGKARLLLQQGSLAGTDLAWSPGMAKWEALTDLLPPGEADAEPASVPAVAANDGFIPATPRQRALLNFLHIGCTTTTTKQDAALLICDAMENPAYSVRLGQWHTERLRLHPDLFAAEIQAKRENRAHHYQMLTQTEGAACFTQVTKGHAQTVITHLDMAHPQWEAREATAAHDWFFPAVAEKFPQLVKPEWQGRLQYPGATPAAPAASAPVSKAVTKPPPRSAPKKTGGPSGLAAGARGLFFGLLLLGIAWFVRKVLHSDTPTVAAPAATATTDATSPEAAPSASPALSDLPASQGAATSSAPTAIPTPPGAEPAPLPGAAPAPAAPPATPAPTPGL